ncbi:hypothetical protein KKC94_04145 [Patescibacteria group bacterium]|nr:hypothetical protein [Patescibacteria group bacterium]
MKKLLFLFPVVLLFASCSVSRLSEVEYNNQIVTAVNETSAVIEKTANAYNESIPEVVTEKTVIEIAPLRTAYNETISSLSTISTLSSLESRNEEQTNTAQELLSRYSASASEYLNEYKAMLEYYEGGEYKNNVTMVSEIDTILHDAYTTFIDANNKLVETLGNFVITE